MLNVSFQSIRFRVTIECVMVITSSPVLHLSRRVSGCSRFHRVCHIFLCRDIHPWYHPSPRSQAVSECRDADLLDSKDMGDCVTAPCSPSLAPSFWLALSAVCFGSQALSTESISTHAQDVMCSYGPLFPSASVRPGGLLRSFN
jgi:hypothetical protein